MRELIDKRNKLNRYSQRLRTLKFDTSVFNPRENKAKITELIKEQNEIYNQFIFYKEYLKELNKERKR